MRHLSSGAFALLHCQEHCWSAPDSIKVVLIFSVCGMSPSPIRSIRCGFEHPIGITARGGWARAEQSQVVGFGGVGSGGRRTGGATLPPKQMIQRPSSGSSVERWLTACVWLGQVARAECAERAAAGRVGHAWRPHPPGGPVCPFLCPSVLFATRCLPDL